MPVLEALDRLARRPDAGGVTRSTAPRRPDVAGADTVAGRRRGGAAGGPADAASSGTARMLREFAAFVESLTASGTLVLVLEDLHWSDPSTVDLLSLLGQRRDPARLLVIGTYRPAEVAVHEHVLATVLQTLRLRHRCVEMPLHELARGGHPGRTSTCAFPPQISPSDSRPWSTSTPDGHPLFMVALVDHLLSRGAILDTAPGWALSTEPSPPRSRGARRHPADDRNAARRLEPGATEAARGRERQPDRHHLADRWRRCWNRGVDDAESVIETLTRPQQFLRAANPAEKYQQKW